ncbi:serine/threonine protein kinase [Massiliimalia massiliensis]|uniref:serine/threonine protein kinase n=1 Tax=Massiliimalia massiliensis TaxID=1852384 RepID=UPI0013564E0A|nr:serine/threonine-protein kinase [Massiliimalia massiliensis]
MNPERVCYGCFAEKEPGKFCTKCGFNENDEQPYLALPLGTILNGRYLVGKVLGIGGFGITYLGYDLTLEIKVAIKEYMPSALATRHPDHYSVALTGRVEQDFQYGMERFLDEAKILAKLQSTPHIVSVQNYFKENGTAYFVMEYIDGMSLKAYLSKNGDKIPCDQAIAILQPIMEALIQVHAMNLLHRDISPDNIYITAKGESRLLDFGAARFALGDGKSVSVILKHGYAPEEQYSSHGNQGPWTDVYAMGATLYRCITGQLPPDSVERIHGDAMKTPSELGFRISAHVENAIMKALAVKTEDRFPNMEAFISALSGRVSVQDQVAASISQRTQATAYGKGGYGQTAYQQPSYSADGSAAGKPSVFSRLLSYMKANPIVAWVSGGGLLAVIALCIILPIALSGGGKTTPAGGNGGGNTPVISQSPASVEPSDPGTTTEPSAGMVKQDLGILNATIEIPTDYTASEDGLNFINEDKGCAVMTDYLWNIDGPIYSLADVESQREAIVTKLMQDLEVSDYQILAAGPDRVGNSEAYQIYFEGTDSEGVSMEMIVMAVGGYEFGCYFIITAYPKGDEAAEAEIHSIIQSFQSNGMPEVTYKAYYAERAGVKVIIDESSAQGGVADMELELNMNGIGTVHEMFLYPTQEDRNAAVGQGFAVEIGKASEFGLSTPEEVIEYNKNVSGTNNESYTFSSGGVEWLAYDFTMGGKNFSYSSAVIDGECYLVGCVFNDSNKDAIVALYNQATASLRAWAG